MWLHVCQFLDTVAVATMKSACYLDFPYDYYFQNVTVTEFVIGSDTNTTVQPQMNIFFIVSIWMSLSELKPLSWIILVLYGSMPYNVYQFLTSI